MKATTHSADDIEAAFQHLSDRGYAVIENVLSGNTLAGRRGSEQATIIRYLKEIEGEAPDGEPRVEGEEIQTEVSSAIRESFRVADPGKWLISGPDDGW